MKDPVYQAAWKRFYVAKSLPTEGTGWLRGTNLVLMTSAGRLLSGAIKNRHGLAPALEAVLKEYAKLPEYERRPKAVEGELKPQEAPPPGGLVLTVYDRLLARGEAGRYRLPGAEDYGGIGTNAPAGQRSSLWLKEAEWKSLVPPDPLKGKTHPVPHNLAKRIFLYALVPQALWVVEENWKPNSVKRGALDLTVEGVTAREVRMRVHGSVLLSAPGVLHTWPDRKIIKNLENRYDARLEGVLVFDRARGRVTRWDLAALGDYTGRWFSTKNGWREATADAPLALGFALEIDRTAYELPPERLRPRSFIHAYIFKEREEFYWDPEKWEADWKKRQK